MHTGKCTAKGQERFPHGQKFCGSTIMCKQSSNQGEERDQGDGHVEDGKTTQQGRREPPATGRQQRTMKGIDGGLRPAVDGQSPGER